MQVQARRERKGEAYDGGASDGASSGDGASEAGDDAEAMPIPSFAEFAHLVTATPEEYAEAFAM